jgi:hypothetical protein
LIILPAAAAAVNGNFLSFFKIKKGKKEKSKSFYPLSRRLARMCLSNIDLNNWDAV